MYLEKPSSPKPKMFYNIQHFLTQSECLMIKQLHYKKGDHYDWHVDVGDDIYSNRKISASLLLSDNCDGGDLVLKQGADRPIHMEVGDMVLFPSYVLHKVKPITKGERWSLVTWVQDTKPFK
jgi:predicted 2-oxoglutarate/Fe(II)-dependent dioxygenase YbiX